MGELARYHGFLRICGRTWSMLVTPGVGATCVSNDGADKYGWHRVTRSPADSMRPHAELRTSVRSSEPVTCDRIRQEPWVGGLAHLWAGPWLGWSRHSPGQQHIIPCRSPGCDCCNHPSTMTDAPLIPLAQYFIERF